MIVQDWNGKYAMNHDGWIGTLEIGDIKADCITSPWCATRLNYTGSDGKRVQGEIDHMDQNFHHMTFYIDFPNNRQKFDAYMLGKEKKQIAGTTYWGNWTFGFYATKILH